MSNSIHDPIQVPARLRSSYWSLRLAFAAAGVETVRAQACSALELTMLTLFASMRRIVGWLLCFLPFAVYSLVFAAGARVAAFAVVPAALGERVQLKVAIQVNFTSLTFVLTCYYFSFS